MVESKSASVNSSTSLCALTLENSDNEAAKRPKNVRFENMTCTVQVMGEG